MSKEKILAIKEMIKEECYKSNNNYIFDVHLVSVEKFAKFLLAKLPETNDEKVMLGIWLHDLQRIRNLKGGHAEVGAREAEKVLQEFGYEESVIKDVKDIILTHPCDSRDLPESVEGKILASVDAMSHYDNNFYLTILIRYKDNIEEFKKWALNKLDRDFNKKIFFDFAKDKIKDEHDALTKIFKMN